MKSKKILATILATVSMITLATFEVNSIELNNQIEVLADDVTTEKAEKLFNLVNEYRAENGLSPFKTCSIMQKMANIRVTEITDGNYTTRGDNQYYNSIFVENNISTFTYSQNTYWGGVGYDTPEDALQQLKSNERNNNNMLSTAYEYIGIGVYVKDNITYYYQLFCTSDDLTEDVTTTTSQTTVITTTSTQPTTTTTVTQPTTTTTTITSTQPTTTTSNNDDFLKEKYNLDVNKNGTINAIDLLILKKYLMGILNG